MHSSILLSVALHVTVILVSIIGLPHIQRSPAMEEIPMIVELVSIASETNLAPQPDVKPKLNKLEEKPPLSSPVKPEFSIASPVESEPNVLAPQLKPKPSHKKPNKTKPEPPAKRTTKTSVPKKLAKLIPRRKPKPPDPFALVLKNLAQDIKTTKLVKKSKKKDKKRDQKSDFEKKISHALTRQRQSEATSSRITMTEMHAMINAIRTAIMPCWNLQPGAKGAQDIVVKIRATLSPDGRVTRAWVMNSAFFHDNPFKLAAAETAQRAILNQACQPFKLDPKKYVIWRDITLSFNPSEMFGR